MVIQMEDIENKLAYMLPQIKDSKISAKSLVAGQTIYVPIYSHIYSRGGKPFLLEIALSVRNSDPDKEITINSVWFYDTNGKLIKNYLEKPLRFSPLATAEFLVEQRKIEGGSDANFLLNGFQT